MIPVPPAVSEQDKWHYVTSRDVDGQMHWSRGRWSHDEMAITVLLIYLKLQQYNTDIQKWCDSTVKIHCYMLYSGYNNHCGCGMCDWWFLILVHLKKVTLELTLDLKLELTPLLTPKLTPNLIFLFKWLIV